VEAVQTFCQLALADSGVADTLIVSGGAIRWQVQTHHFEAELWAGRL
jgi:hypothetical protein